MPVPKRAQPIRYAILMFLSEPRSARAIADHIGRPVPTATGHLAAMRRRNLVQRLGYAAYARALTMPGRRWNSVAAKRPAPQPAEQRRRI